MRAADRVAHVRHGDRHRERHAVVAAARHQGALRFNAARVDAVRLRGQLRRHRLELAALDLLRRRQRQRVDERHVARRLEVRQLRERVLDQCAGELGAFGRWQRLPRHDAGQHLVAAHRVGRGRHRRCLHQRMLIQHALDLDRRDVFAAAPDDVLLAVDEVQVACVVGAHDVAGVEPAAGPGLFGGRFVFQVAAEETASRIGAAGAHPQLAGHAGVDVGACVIHQAPLHRRVGAAEATGADVARLAVRHHAGRRAGFGHRPRLEQRKAEARLERRVQLAVDAGAKADAHRVLAIRRPTARRANSIAGITPR